MYKIEIRTIYVILADKAKKILVLTMIETYCLVVFLKFSWIFLKNK